MAHLKKGQLTTPGEWAKHLRKVKRLFWHAERKAARQEIQHQLKEEQEAPRQLADDTSPGADLHAQPQSTHAAMPGQK